MSFVLFRLRTDDQILGYMKVCSNGRIDYSKDFFWWTGTPITFDAKDQHCGLKDKTNRPLFELDVVTIKPTPPAKLKPMGIIQYHSEHQYFVILDLDTPKEYPLFANGQPLFHSSELTFVGVSFNDAW